ncbi:putative quinol monooxygenase [Streptomyces sp. NPDC001507]|uniref:putative quinol monooxygenase n=1 Tax=Streptomyces sp. NPDC001507 TaxID=3364579 RepID=UPI0036B16198
MTATSEETPKNAPLAAKADALTQAPAGTITLPYYGTSGGPMTKNGYALIVRCTIRDADAARHFDALVARTLEGVREEPGALVYVNHIPDNEPLQRVIYEFYPDEAAFQTHVNQSHTQTMAKEVEQYLVSMEITFLHEQAGKRPAQAP